MYRVVDIFEHAYVLTKGSNLTYMFCFRHNHENESQAMCAQYIRVYPCGCKGTHHLAEWISVCGGCAPALYSLVWFKYFA